MKRFLLATAAIAVLAAAPASARTMGTSPSGTAPTPKSSPCMSNGAPPSTNIDRSGTGSGNKPSTTSSSGATTGTRSLNNSGTGTPPNTASDGTAC
jgi:hypothetical protein